MFMLDISVVGRDDNVDIVDGEEAEDPPPPPPLLTAPPMIPVLEGEHPVVDLPPSPSISDGEDGEGKVDAIAVNFASVLGDGIDRIDDVVVIELVPEMVADKPVAANRFPAVNDGDDGGG